MRRAGAQNDRLSRGGIAEMFSCFYLTVRDS